LFQNSILGLRKHINLFKTIYSQSYIKRYKID